MLSCFQVSKLGAEMFAMYESLPLSACHSWLWPLAEVWSFRTVQWASLPSWVGKQECWMTLYLSSICSWLFVLTLRIYWC